MEKSSNKQPHDKAESKIQQEIVQWYKNTFCLKHHSPRCMIFSIPNEGGQAKTSQLIATGLYPGAADLGGIHIRNVSFEVDEERLSVRGGVYRKINTQTFFVECKTDIGVQSDKQKIFQKHCQDIGIPYKVVRSLDDFKQFIYYL